MRLTSLGAVAAMLVVAGFVQAEESNSATWQPMLSRSFENGAEGLRISGLVVDRKVGCVFLSVEGKGIYCSSAGANRFSPNKKTWEQVTKLRRNDLEHKFILTGRGIKESTDGGVTWSEPIPAPRGFVITEHTWLEYDAKCDFLYLMKPGSDLYKLARGKVRSDELAKGKSE